MAKGTSFFPSPLTILNLGGIHRLTPDCILMTVRLIDKWLLRNRVRHEALGKLTSIFPSQLACTCMSDVSQPSLLVILAQQYSINNTSVQGIASDDSNDIAIIFDLDPASFPPNV
nr:hypothetical protein [Paenibacillus sp. 1-18]